MTAAQQIMQQGEAKGMQEGEQNKALAIARTMLQSNEPKEKVHQFTGLSWVELEGLIREQEAAKK